MHKDDLKRDVKDKAENIKGRVKQAFGALSGNKRTEAEGAAERIDGAAREKVHDIKRAAGLHEEADDE